MKPFLFALLLATSLSAQHQVDVWVHSTQPPDYTGPFYRALEQGVSVASGVRQAQIEHGQFDLARQQERRAAEAAHESARLQDRVLDENLGYRDSRGSVADWRLNQDVTNAFAAGRKTHPDFDVLVPAMRIIADAIRPNWSRMSMTEYLECLYSIAKTAAFAEPVRQKLLESNRQQ